MLYTSQQLNSILLLNPHLIQEQVPLADKNWFGTGGAARYFSEPRTADEFQHALSYASIYELPQLVIGQGANMLISDEGVKGLVIRPQLTGIRRYPHDEGHDIVEAEAGVSLDTLISWCLENNLSGLEEFSGIPGTVGGSVFINIHYYEFLLSHFLVSAQVINRNTGQMQLVDATWFNFGYNESTLQARNHYLVSAQFKLKKIETTAALYSKGRSDEIIRHRAKRYPSKYTCGSFFRNFSETEVAHTDKKLIYVAYYLDKIGVKGELSVGDAIVSHQHANMIVNRGNATSTDIITLAGKMQELVHQQFGLLPQPECQLIGFSSYPLLSY